jgi:hypothetical protein
MIDYLHGDHIWPYSLFGETSWANYQLICGNCNAAKSNRLDSDVRKTLGGGAFRKGVIAFLRQQINDGSLSIDAVLTNILGDTGSTPA